MIGQRQNDHVAASSNMAKILLLGFDIREAFTLLVYLFLFLLFLFHQDPTPWAWPWFAVSMLIIFSFVGLHWRAEQATQQRLQAATSKAMLIPQWTAEGKIGKAPLLAALLRFLEALGLARCDDWAGLNHCLYNLGCLPRLPQEQMIWLGSKSELAHLRSWIEDHFQVPARGINQIFAGLFVWRDEQGTPLPFTGDKFRKICSEVRTQGWGKEAKLREKLHCFL